MGRKSDHLTCELVGAGAFDGDDQVILRRAAVAYKQPRYEQILQQLPRTPGSALLLYPTR
jgi:hypothetical protein